MNMSYCRFENTSKDMKDCFNALQEGIIYGELSSDYERQGFKRFLEICMEVSSYVKENREELDNDEAVAQFIEDECQ